MNHDRIAVIDFGGQYAHLIANKVRRLHVLGEIRQPEDPPGAYDGFSGIIISGSPSLSAFDEDASYDKRIFDLGIPILGFCFGHQEIAKRYGGGVEHTQREYGFARMKITNPSPIFYGLDPEQVVWMSHGDTVTRLPGGFREIGVSIDGDGLVHHNTAICDDERRCYGLQFHAEVDDTEHGDEMIANFVFRICGCKPTWTMQQYLADQMAEIGKLAEEKGVFLLVSGGVDSTVCAKLLGEATGPERLHLLHIDNGLMRKNESAMVVQELKRLGLGTNLHFVDASERFLDALKGAVEPEVKRRIIGETFVRVFEDEAKRLDLSHMLLGQGTIYPDTVETGGPKRADTIKTHHNRVPLIEEMIKQGRVIEPLKELYKVEVREMGERLGIDPAMVWRHPFPGPGLGVRALCSDGREPKLDHDPADIQAKIDAIVAPAGVHGAMLPVKSVGVKADLRSYEHPIMVWGKATDDQLMRLAPQLYGRVPGVNRCVYDLTGKGFKNAKPVAATLTRARLDLLREADDIVMRALGRHNLLREVWQCPTVLLPMSLDGRGTEVVIIRPVLSERAMTARPASLPTALINEILPEITALPQVGGLLIDITTKPPGTIEWE